MEADLRDILILLGVVIVIGGLCIYLITPSEEQANVTERAVEQVSIQEEEEEMEIIGTYDTGFIHLYKMHDNKDNVTCWVYREGQGGGISCIPDHMLSL